MISLDNEVHMSIVIQIELIMQRCISIPSSTSFAWSFMTDSKKKQYMFRVSRIIWPVGGEPALRETIFTNLKMEGQKCQNSILKNPEICDNVIEIGNA